jgi:hypothetical protein
VVQLLANGLSQKVLDLHNDAIDALAIELGGDNDEIWQSVIEIENENRECRKILNEIKQDLSDTVDRGNPRNNKKHYKKAL